VLAFKFD